VVADPERVAAAHVALLTKSRAAIEAASREGTRLDLSPLLGGAPVSEDAMREACVGAVRAMRFEFRASGSVVFGTGDDIMAGSWTRRDGGAEVLIQLEEWGASTAPLLPRATSMQVVRRGELLVWVLPLGDGSSLETEFNRM
jgi:hypothetical protein